MQRAPIPNPSRVAAKIATMPIIRAEHLSKTFRVSIKQPGLMGTFRHFFSRKYRDIQAVKDVSFSVEPGEIVGFLGPNGAGKTTTLKMLTGLIHPSGGSVEVTGQNPFRRKADFLSRITLVMGQKQQLIWDLPAIDSLKINAAVYDIPRATFESRLAELSEMLKLDEQLTQPVRKLSLGERMKAELLAALIHQPQVLFLDEPTLGLDVNAQATVRQFLKDYNRKFGATILLTSHYMADITALCPRVMLIHEGSLFYDGSLDSLLERFSPTREVAIDFGSPHTRQELETFGEVVAADARQARILVGRENLTQTVARMLTQLDVADLTISDPPIEQIIGRLFLKGSVSEGQA